MRDLSLLCCSTACWKRFRKREAELWHNTVTFGKAHPGFSPVTSCSKSHWSSFCSCLSQKEGEPRHSLLLYLMFVKENAVLLKLRGINIAKMCANTTLSTQAQEFKTCGSTLERTINVHLNNYSESLEICVHLNFELGFHCFTLKCNDCVDPKGSSWYRGWG